MPTFRRNLQNTYPHTKEICKTFNHPHMNASTKYVYHTTKIRWWKEKSYIKNLCLNITNSQLEIFNEV
jgi:hypothetical protein